MLEYHQVKLPDGLN